MRSFLYCMLILGAFCKAPLFSEPPPLPPLRAGDLVFRLGKGLWSGHFRDCSSREKRFSHVGIVVGAEADRVVHADADDRTGVGAVRVEPLPAFLETAVEAAIYRFAGEESLSRAMSERALRHVGTPFDAMFDMATTNRLYCTELVRLAVNGTLGEEAIGHTMVKGRPLVAVDDCYRDSRFVRIYDRPATPVGAAGPASRPTSEAR